MSITGTAIRLSRIMNQTTHKTVIVPMDHGAAFGPLKGLEDMPATIDAIAEGGANAVLVQKGLVARGFRGFGKDIGLIIHLSASTSLSPDPNVKVLVASVEEALALGTDAVSVHINVGTDGDGTMLEQLGAVSESCAQWGVPLIAMMYPRGEHIKDPHDVDTIKQVSRLGAELGADIVKTNYTGDVGTFKEVVRSCPAPIVIAGGPKVNSDKELLAMIADAMEAGAAGTAIGRNIFQHKNVTGITRAISAVVHDGAPVAEAMKFIKKG